MVFGTAVANPGELIMFGSICVNLSS
ncbi:uncharacterized protein METZ01_LOCUS510515 [marine metagenome]|uniref:Uncharacterized protein n=1 Tax=marine metagenome TaxID=408172 RepID=A0A383ELM9_9ZZZZ